MVKRASAATFIDTHFVVALVNQRDEHHDAAMKLSANYVGRPLVTTDIVLVEIGNALSRSFKAQAVEVIDFFHRAANVEIVRLTTPIFESAFALFRSRGDKSWGMTDCISFVVMQQEGVHDVLTNDQHFTQAGFNALLSGNAEV